MQVGKRFAAAALIIEGSTKFKPDVFWHYGPILEKDALRRGIASIGDLGRIRAVVKKLFHGESA